MRVESILFCIVAVANAISCNLPSASLKSSKADVAAAAKIREVILFESALKRTKKLDCKSLLKR